MTTTLALSAANWIVIGMAVAIGLLGLGLMAVNLAAIVMPRKAGQTGAPRKLVGKPQQLTRRRFLGRVLGGGFGLAMGGFGLTSLGMLWPSFAGGFGGVVTVPDTADAVKARIRDEKRPYYFGPGRFYLVAYEAKNEADAALYNESTTSLGGATLVSEGLQALYQRCVHLGCRVPFCDSSQWFECPCHGSKYNGVGEFKDGPAPRGLDRFPIKVENGVIRVDTGNAITGPPRGIDSTEQQPEGAFCVTLTGAEE